MSWHFKPGRLLSNRTAGHQARAPPLIVEVFGDMPTDETGASVIKNRIRRIERRVPQIQRSVRCKVNIDREIHFLALQIVNPC